MSVKTQSIIGILRKEGRNPNETSVWLESSQEARDFHCTRCRALQFRMQHRVIALINDDLTQVLKQPPISVQCLKCGNIYHVHVM